MKAPTTYNGKRLVYEEVFRSKESQLTEDEALEKLDKIRASHSEKNGWVEICKRLEFYDGGWHAVRHHALYK